MTKRKAREIWIRDLHFKRLGGRSRLSSYACVHLKKPVAAAIHLFVRFVESPPRKKARKKK